MRTLTAIIMLNILLLSPVAQAQEGGGTVYRFEDPTGMESTITLPYGGEIVTRLQGLRDRIELRCAQLEDRVEKAVLTPARMLFAAVMPGGILITAITRERGRQASQELSQLNQELDELGGDLKYWTKQKETLALAHVQ